MIKLNIIYLIAVFFIVNALFLLVLYSLMLRKMTTLIDLIIEENAKLISGVSIQHTKEEKVDKEKGDRDQPPSLQKKVASLHLLTDREKEVALQLVRGLTYYEIAIALVISENTVRSHIKKIYEKMQVNSRKNLYYRVTRLSEYEYKG